MGRGDVMATAVYPSGSQQAALVLRIFVFSAFVLPTDTVIRVIGAQGYVANLVAMLLFAAWGLTAIFGFHDPVHTRHPTRGALGLLWISSLLSYAAMPFYLPDETQRLSAERWMMLLIGMSGVILVAAEHLRTPADLMRTLRTLVWGGTFSAGVAVLQFWLHWDLRPTLRLLLVGFTSSDAYTGFQDRAALVRVSGTANHPIEFGVVAAMLLPLAIWLAFNDQSRSATRRWGPVVLIALCIPMSVSRSAILAVVVSLGVFVICLPVVQRAWVLAATPLGIVAVFATTPGYLTTIFDSFLAGKSDSSITNRLNNYPRVVAFVQGAPWFGRGGGTYLAPDATKILDNQYLKSAIETGLFGVFALVMFFLVPPLAALVARRRSGEPNFRSLCAALAGACLAAAVGSYTFDAFSFPQFASVDAIMIGLCGACWLGAQRWPRGLPAAAIALPRRGSARPPVMSSRPSYAEPVGRSPLLRESSL
jgi:O-antigen ligase